MNKKLFLLKTFFLFLCFSTVHAEETAVTEMVAKAKVETAKQAEESKSIIQQTMAAEANVSGSTSAQKKAVEKSKVWIPSAVDYDWIQLTSNEWLKGEIKAMYQESLEFDSDKLGLLTIDWEDVKILRSDKNSSVNIDGFGVTNGILEVTGQTVEIKNKYEDRTFDRSQLISFAAGGEVEADLWAIKVTMGLDVRQGNTDQLDFMAKANLKRRASITRFVLDYIGTISKTDGGNNGNLIEAVNNHRITANYDYYKTRHFFYNPVYAELFKDPFLNIELRTTISTGLGYTVIDNGITELSFSGGPSLVKTDFNSVEAGEEDKQVTAALVLRADYDTELSDTLDIIAKYNIQYGDQASGGYTHHMIATFENELTNDLDLDISLIWDRVDSPTKDAGGNTPESDDFRMTVGLTYTY